MVLGCASFEKFVKARKNDIGKALAPRKDKVSICRRLSRALELTMADLAIMSNYWFQFHGNA
jgi:hypothetical protein